ncbi:MAG: YihY/virulence factor BrkB family protein [Spirochaetota bacterium]|jgi:membrane protein|nr:YihY/virulence factor BrkB family protein [Spirochaetota bacterium]
MRILDTIRVFLQADIWNDELLRQSPRFKRMAMIWLRYRILEFKLFFRNRNLKSASSLSFSTIVAIIPLLVVLFMIFKMIDGRHLLEKIKPSLYALLSPGAGDEFTNTLEGMLESATVETLGIFGIVFLLVSVYSLFSSIEEAVNQIWGVDRKRRLLESIKTYGFLVISIPFFLIISYLVSSHVQDVSAEVVGGFSNFIGTVFFPFFIVLVIFFIFIYLIPNCRIFMRKAWTGAITGAALYSITETGFLYYTRMAASKNIIYGSLAVLPFFFLWLYIAWAIVLYAVTLAYVRQNFEFLTGLEQNREICHADEIRLGVMTAIAFTREALTLHKENAGLSPSDIAALTRAPMQDVMEILSRLEKTSLIARIAEKDERYLLRISPTECTLGMVLDAVDRAFLEARRYTGEANFPIYTRLFDKNILRQKRYRGFPMLSVTEMNASLLEGKEPPSDALRS